MEYIKLPSTLAEFSNYETTIEINRAGREEYVIYGSLNSNEPVSVCPCCGAKIHIYHSRKVELRHLPFGRRGSVVRCERHRYLCSTCKHTENHRMTTDLFDDTDTHRLQGLYTVTTEDGEYRLAQPERQAKFLGIDEFLLHKGHKLATVIIDLETGYILWLAHGKKKACVYSFI